MPRCGIYTFPAAVLIEDHWSLLFSAFLHTAYGSEANPSADCVLHSIPADPSRTAAQTAYPLYHTIMPVLALQEYIADLPQFHNICRQPPDGSFPSALPYNSRLPDAPAELPVSASSIPVWILPRTGSRLPAALSILQADSRLPHFLHPLLFDMQQSLLLYFLSAWRPLPDDTMQMHCHAACPVLKCGLPAPHPVPGSSRTPPDCLRYNPDWLHAGSIPLQWMDFVSLSYPLSRNTHTKILQVHSFQTLPFPACPSLFYTPTSVSSHLWHPDITSLPLPEKLHPCRHFQNMPLLLSAAPQRYNPSKSESLLHTLLPVLHPPASLLQTAPEPPDTHPDFLLFPYKSAPLHRWT